LAATHDRLLRILQAVLAMALALAGNLAAPVVPARAQDWPTRPISLVVPFGPGSGTDLVARNLTRTELSDLKAGQAARRSTPGSPLGSSRAGE
jgi:tripartite-type tricarboxylate transporter receptor subunit TctC